MAVFRQQNNYMTDFEDTGLFGGGSLVADMFADIVPELAPITTSAVTAQQQVQAPVDNKTTVINNLTNQILSQGTTNKWTGEGLGSAEANAKDMAKILADTGITDIGQFGEITKTTPAYSYETEQGTVDVPEQTTITYGNKLTGQEVANTYGERQGGNAFGGTYSGSGNTGYRVNFDSNGNPVFYTAGASSSDVGDLMPLIQVGLLATGAGGLLGNALLGAGANQVAASALGGALLGGGTAALSDQDILKGALIGGLGGAASGYLSPDVSVATATDADIAGGLVPNYGTNTAYDQFMSSAMTPEASAAIAEMIAPTIQAPVQEVTPAPTVEVPQYVPPAEVTVTPVPEPAPVVSEPAQAPTVTEAPTVDAAPVDNIPEMVITPEPTIAPQPVTASDLGIDYSLSNGTVMNPLTDMGGAQGIQAGTSANLADMGGGQGLTINVGAPSTTLADALATFGGVNPAYLADMGGAQGLTYQTPTGLVTESAIIPATGLLSTLGETGINTATNIGSGIGTELANLNTGVDQAVTAPTTPSVTPAEKNLLSGLTPSQIANLLKGAMGLFSALGASKLASGGTSAPSVGALPTQGIPLNSQDYFNAIQQNYNTLLPAMPKDVATPLASWYNSQYTGA